MKKTSGFTIMELMTVIAIMGIIGAIATPNLIAWRSNHQLNGSAREVQAFINGARLEAVKNNTRVTVTIDPGGRKITRLYENRADENLPPVEKEIFLKPGINIDVASTNFPADPDDASQFSFNFNSRGFPSNFGTISLRKSDGETREVIMSRTGDTRIG